MKSGDELKSFRNMVGNSQDQMAQALGYSRRNYQLMERSKSAVRKSVALACAAYALGIREYDGPTVRAQWLRRNNKKGK